MGEMSEKLIMEKPLPSSMPPIFAMISAACLGEMRYEKGYFSKLRESVTREKITVSFSYPGVLYQAIFFDLLTMHSVTGAYVSGHAKELLSQNPRQAQPASSARARVRHVPRARGAA